ncbi:MAG: hypothetical protein R2856_00630 [Caldilineaceae bacterium]
MNRQWSSRFQAHRVGQRVTIQSFDHRSLGATRRIAPQLRLSALVTDAGCRATRFTRCTVLAAAGSGDAVAFVSGPCPRREGHPVDGQRSCNDMQRLISSMVDGLDYRQADLLVALEQKQE